jgi:dipeptidyl aminopeptidase/acylaminoacyl peptidase
LAILALANFAIAFAQSPAFAPAYFHESDKRETLLTLLPAQSPAVTLALPGVRGTPTLVGGNPDGTSIYIQPWNTKGVTKLEFKSARQSLVPGSEALDRVSFVTASTTGRLFLTGCRKAEPIWECGVFEIDPAGAARPRRIREGFSQSYGEVSPDGTRALLTEGNFLSHVPIRLSVVDLATGGAQAIKGASSGSWSPDGRWLAVLRNNRLELLDATTLVRHKNLGSADALGVWSPDSKYMLFIKSQFSCILTLYFESLETIDVDTGKRKLVRGSHCEVGGGWWTWADPAAVQ